MHFFDTFYTKLFLAICVYFVKSKHYQECTFTVCYVQFINYLLGFTN